MNHAPDDGRGQPEAASGAPHVDDVLAAPGRSAPGLGARPPHVDDVLGVPPPPPPPGPRDGTGGGGLDERFPPHSRARLLLLLAAAPVMSALLHLRDGGEGGVLRWAVITLASMAIFGAAWWHGRREVRRREGPVLPPVLARGRGEGSPLRILLPFLLPFVFMAALMLVMGGDDPGVTLVTAAVGGIFFGLVWHLRGTLPGLLLVALVGGACVAFFLEILDFIGSLWGTGEDFNFWLSWLLAAAVIAPVLWPWWRKIRYLEVNVPLAVVAIVLGLTTTLFAAASARSVGPDGGDARGPAHASVRAPTPPAPTGPVGAPTQQEAAARLFATWRFGNRGGAEKVASPDAVEALFAIPPAPRDRLLGCGTFDGHFSECRLESVHAGVLTLGWRMASDGTFWIDYVAPVAAR